MNIYQTIKYLIDIVIKCHNIYQDDYENSLIKQTLTGNLPCAGHVVMQRRVKYDPWPLVAPAQR